MPSNTASSAEPDFTVSAPDKSNIRWFVCALLFAATFISNMVGEIVIHRFKNKLEGKR